MLYNRFAGSLKPQPVRRVEIPKPNGGVGKQKLKILALVYTRTVQQICDFLIEFLRWVW
jgi:retron-type reverse transcriptase